MTRQFRPARLLLSVSLAAALPGAGLFIPAAAQESSFVECRDITDDTRRLACYDRLADAILDVPEETRAEAIEKQPTEVVRAPEPAPTVAAAPTVEQRQRLAQEDNLARELDKQATQEEKFGSENIPLINRKDREDRLDELTQEITAYRILPYGNIRVVLENGQIWEQPENSGRNLRRVDDEDIQTATIERAALGSYRMKIEPIGRSVKVRRVK